MNTSILPPEAADHQARVVALASRQAALEDMLVAYRRVIAKIRSSDERAAALAAGYVELHDWLAEAGRENAVELALLKQTVIPHPKSVGVGPRLRARLERLIATLATGRT